MGHILISKLIDIACNGITQYYNAATNLFNFVMTDGSIKKERKQLLLTHSLISLLGILEHKSSIKIDYEKSIDKIFELIVRDNREIRELSLLLWLLAKENDGRAEKTFEYIEKLPDKKLYLTETMELAWILTAMVFEFQRKNNSYVKSKLCDTAKLLKKRFINKNKLFLHRDNASAKRGIRYNIANFADQIYSIYALSMYTYATKDDQYLETANLCANKISSLQGKEGQWWWHYNALTGEVIQKYPVFSVHQDSMAPFALMALSEVSKHNYTPNVLKGIQWVFGKNELGTEMVNWNRNFVRRGVERKCPLSKIQNIVTIATNYGLMHGIGRKYDEPKYLKIMDWEYSYHLGWILYAYNEKNKHLWHQF